MINGTIGVMDENDQLPCVEKMTFESQKEAEASAVAIAWQRGISLKAYLCRYCRLWHLSTNYDKNH